jgi:hypothetical protein
MVLYWPFFIHFWILTIPTYLSVYTKIARSEHLDIWANYKDNKIVENKNYLRIVWQGPQTSQMLSLSAPIHSLPTMTLCFLQALQLSHELIYILMQMPTPRAGYVLYRPPLTIFSGGATILRIHSPWSYHPRIYSPWSYHSRIFESVREGMISS